MGIEGEGARFDGDGFSDPVEEEIGGADLLSFDVLVNGGGRHCCPKGELSSGGERMWWRLDSEGKKRGGLRGNKVWVFGVLGFGCAL